MSVNRVKPHLFVFLALLFASCSAPAAEELAQVPLEVSAPRQEQMLNPGDRIGEMEITTADMWDTDIDIFSLCIEGNAENEALREEDRDVYEYSCDLDTGAQLIFSCIGVVAEADENLDELWSRLESEMILDGRPSFDITSLSADRF